MGPQSGSDLPSTFHATPPRTMPHVRSNFPPLCSDCARLVATSAIQWYTGMTAGCILRGRDRLCLLGRPLHGSKLTQYARVWIRCTVCALASTRFFGDLWLHTVLVYVRAPTVCTDSDFRGFSADVLFPSIVADPWFAVPSSI